MNLLDPVSTIMTQKLITVDPRDLLDKVKTIFDTHKIHHLPVVRYKTLLGIVSKSDLLFALRGLRNDNSEAVINQTRLNNYCVETIMTTGLATVSSDERINVVLEIFKENLFHAIPVVDDGELAGIVTTYDIIKALSEEKITN